MDANKENRMRLNTSYRDAAGNEIDLSGDSVEEIAQQLPEDYSGPRLTVHDEPGFVRGWIGSQNDWTAQ